MMSYSNRLSNSNTDPKNETVQTIPERDITLCAPANSSNSTNASTTTTYNPAATLISSNNKSYLKQNPQQTSSSYHHHHQRHQMNQFNANNQPNDNNIPYLNSNMNKLTLNNANGAAVNSLRTDFQLNTYLNTQHEYLQQPAPPHFDYTNLQHNKHYTMQGPLMNQQPYQRTSLYDRDDLNFTNTSNASNLMGHNMDPLSNITNNITIDRLRAKVLLLEHQASNNTQPNMNAQYQKPINLFGLEIQQAESHIAQLKAELGSMASKETKMQKLEELICQREYEIEELLKKSKDEKADYEQEIAKLKQNVQKKDEELIEFRTHLTNSQKECDMFKLKYRELDAYMSTCPTNAEVDEAKKLVYDAKQENERLKTEITNAEKRLHRAKVYIKEKQNEVKDFDEKLKNAALDREALQKEYDRFRELSKSVDELIDLRKENSKVNAELDCARKLINAHREQINSLQAKHQEEVYKLKEQIRLENELTIALREEVEAKEKSLNELKSSVKEISNYNQCLINNNLDLNSKITSYETVMNTDYQKLLKKLCKELEVSKNKLKILVENCICIYEGKDFNTALLISDVGVNYSQFDEGDQIMTGVLTPAYLRTALNDLKTLQEKIDTLRLAVSSKFAEKLGGDATACVVQ